jgi:uncharacterized protein (TIGR02145 family)
MKQLLFFASILLLSLSACNSDDKSGQDIAVTSIEMSQPTATIAVGEELQLTATALPEEATDRTITWTSSANEIASVAYGLVMANSTGSATITATSANGMTATCEITVGEPAVEVTGITLNVELIRLPMGDKRILKATVLPEDAGNKDVVWKSSDESLATVAEDGTVTAMDEVGNVEITATTVSGGLEAKCKIELITTAIDCATMEPGWGDSLGKVTFRTDKTWTVGEQTWSDVVMAERCEKETFDSGGYPAYKADCRNNGEYGHLFSWAAVYRFQTEICPDGWRVPSEYDYILLDKAFGGTGEYQSNMNDVVAETYLSPEVWGGQRSGYCGNNGAIINQESYCGYWTESQDGRYGITLTISSDGFLAPAMANMKYVGFPVRCVK